MVFANKCLAWAELSLKYIKPFETFQTDPRSFMSNVIEVFMQNELMTFQENSYKYCFC